jgi:hypothetical protein
MAIENPPQCGQIADPSTRRDHLQGKRSLLKKPLSFIQPQPPHEGGRGLTKLLFTPSTERPRTHANSPRHPLNREILVEVLKDECCQATRTGRFTLLVS